MHAWFDRRRTEFQHTSTKLRVAGALGWALVALIVLDWVR